MPPVLISTSLSSQDGPEEVGDPSRAGEGGATHVAAAQPNHAVAVDGDDAPRQWAQAAAELAIPRADVHSNGSDVEVTSEDARETKD